MPRRLTGAALVADLERCFVTVNDDVALGGHVVNVIRPRSAEDLIDESDFARDERLPYWAELWPSSTVLAAFVLAEAAVTIPGPARGETHAIELGAGIGLVSIAAAMAGYHITATDYYDDALDFTRANAYRNLGREIATLALDWRSIPPSLPRFELVLASDVLYESRYAPLVASTIDRCMAPSGVAYVADPGRVAVGAFADACAELGLVTSTAGTRPYLAGRIRQQIVIHRITRPECQHPHTDDEPECG